LRGLLKEATAKNDQSMASPKVQALWALLTLSEADENVSRVLSTLPNNYQRKVFMAFTHFVEQRDMAHDACDRVDREDPFQDAASTVMDRPLPPVPQPPSLRSGRNPKRPRLDHPSHRRTGADQGGTCRKGQTHRRAEAPNSREWFAAPDAAAGTVAAAERIERRFRSATYRPAFGCVDTRVHSPDCLASPSYRASKLTRTDSSL
jgi:hypothetical protein